MRVEKQENQINYWRVIDDGLKSDITIGIEHRDGKLTALQMSNPNVPRIMALNGTEIEAIALVFNESGFKIEQNGPEDTNVV